MDIKALHAARALFGALDLSAENNRLAELQADLARVNEAITRADERISEIKRLRSADGPDGEAVANALLSGADAMVAARTGPTSDQLTEELNSLRAGIGELNGQARVIREHMDQVRQDAAHRAAECANGLVGALMAEMRSDAERIVEGFAAIAAINNAARGHAAERMLANNAVEGLSGSDKLLGSRRSIDVPRDIRDLLAVLADKGPAIRPMLAPSIARW